MQFKNIPGKNWEWGHTEHRHQGVQTYKGKLLWYTQVKPYYAGGGAKFQTFEDFAENGPPFDDVPREILDEIYDLMKVPKKKRKY